jgi:hypothetical protein
VTNTFQGVIHTQTHKKRFLVVLYADRTVMSIEDPRDPKATLTGCFLHCTFIYGFMNSISGYLYMQYTVENANPISHYVSAIMTFYFPNPS